MINACERSILGEHPETKAYLLQGHEMQETHATQGSPIQEGQGVALLAGSSTL